MGVSRWRMVYVVARTLLAGAVGGALFLWAGMPAPWLAGAMVGTALCLAAGAEVAVPDGARRAVFVLIGLSIGSSVDSATLARMASWPTSLIMLAVTVAVVTAAQYYYFQAAHGWGRRTAFFAGLPGALSTVLLLAQHHAADLPRVTVAQSVRLFFLIALLPLAISNLGGAQDAAPSPMPPAEWPDTLIVILVGTIAGFLAERLRVPAGLMLAPALANVALHLSGLVHGGLPDFLLVPGYVVLGCMVAARFAGIGMRLLRGMLAASSIGFAVALALSALGAYVASALSGLPFGQTWLAFAPGGLETMTIMAFALDMDPAFVGALQIARFLGLSIAIPLVAAWLFGRPAPESGPAHEP